MEEISNIHMVAGAGFVLAMFFGAIANKTNFCTMGAISDWVNMGSTGRLGAWVLAMGIAVAGTLMLEMTGLVDITSSIYRTANFGIGGYVFGGLLFGVGMTLSGGCGQRTLVRVGTGNLKALVVFMVMGLSAYMTLRGILGVVRLEIFEPMSVDLTTQGIEEQGLAAVGSQWFGLELTSTLRWLVGGIVASLLLLWSLSRKALREDSDNLLAGVSIGLIVVGSWVITGYLGLDDFDPVPVEGFTFVAPTGNTISYLMTYTGATISFGVAAVFGMITGSFFYALFTRTLAIETFTDRQDMINHLLGGLFMGFGGVLSLGCTIGQAVSGISTLALGSFIVALSIIAGSVATMRFQYHRMDEMSTLGALGVSITDTLMPWRMKD
ncbi:hypothetical protein AB833_31740 [Chromatiales bacterium (ex Bugula neritina AB1)]|nr:hypothetical protein AB833_31740 [Chromatiales bacterium (ex Bugula neritina AB1)]